jgi:hypothetical protein
MSNDFGWVPSPPPLTEDELRMFQELQALSARLPWVLQPPDVLGLSVRAFNCLQWNFRTRCLGMLVQQPEWALLKMKNLGRITLMEIRAALAEHGLRLNMTLADITATGPPSPLPTLAALAPAEFAVWRLRPRSPEEELLLRGVAPDRPWTECLQLSVGAHFALARFGETSSVLSVLTAVRNAELGPESLGDRACSEIRVALEALGEPLPPEGVGEEQLPGDVRLLAGLALCQVPERHRSMVEEYYLRGRTYDQVGAMFCLSTERIRQILFRRTWRIPRPLKERLRRVTAPLAAELAAAGSLDEGRVKALTGTSDLRWARLALAFAGRYGALVRRGLLVLPESQRRYYST